MNKIVYAALTALLIPVYGEAQVTVKMPEDQNGNKFSVEHMLVSDMTKPRKERPKAVVDSVAVIDGILKFELDKGGAARYVIPFGSREAVQLYTMPGDVLRVDVVSVSPLEYKVSGTPLMEGMSVVNDINSLIRKRYMALREANASDAEFEAMNKEYDEQIRKFISENQGNPATLYAWSNIGGEEFVAAVENANEAFKNSAIYPLVLNQKKQVEQSLAAERRQQELQSGNVDAPNFTFKNLDGKEVSLSDFKGKWVILDFWGGWCPWCIKGFPQLKEAYAKYKPELEIIGIDCNESEDAWRKAVAKYELPWVQVYNPNQSGEGVLADYGVTGFPTKAIINPEGKIANITVGEDPSFFETLSNLIKK